MADTDNLVLEHLRAIRSELSEMRSENRATRLRVAHLEEQSASLFRQTAGVSSRLDRVYDMVQIITKRPELVD